MKPTFLGGLSARQFMRSHWHKQPLLVRGAFANWRAPFTAAEVLALARRDDVESRLVQRDGRRWALQHGPFAARELKRLPERAWTVLVQDTQHVSAAARALLAEFNFIPHARLDDVMVSLAAPGGGVGPHVDSYDVFLLQGSGRRRWRISAQSDLALRTDTPLKILKRFKAEQEWVVECGDLLYLPPGYAHEGVALDECLTYSIGFRSPSHQELVTAFLDSLRDRIEIPGRHADPDLLPTSRPGAIPTAMLRDLAQVIAAIQWQPAAVEDFIGRYLSEPKAHVYFDPPQVPLSKRRFLDACRHGGIALDPRTRLLYRGRQIFINGESVRMPAGDMAVLQQLADRRWLGPAAVPDHLGETLYQWYCCGYLVPQPASDHEQRT